MHISTLINATMSKTRFSSYFFDKKSSFSIDFEMAQDKATSLEDKITEMKQNFKTKEQEAKESHDKTVQVRCRGVLLFSFSDDKVFFRSRVKSNVSGFFVISQKLFS